MRASLLSVATALFWVGCGSSPSTLASGQHPVNIAVDATSVYWTDNSDTAQLGSVMKVALAGGTPVVLATSTNPTAIAVDATSVYWTDPWDGTIMKVALAGGTPVALATSTYPNGIAVDATSVYWTTDLTVMKVALSGGTAVTLTNKSGSVAGEPQSIAVDATGVYYPASDSSSLSPSGVGSIAKVALSGGTPATLATGYYLQGIAVDTAAVYYSVGSFVSYPEGGVETVGLSGGTPAVLAISHAVGNIVIEAGDVYWSDPYTGTVKKVPRAKKRLCGNRVCVNRG